MSECACGADIYIMFVCYAGVALQEGQPVLLEVALKNGLPSENRGICSPCSEGNQQPGKTSVRSLRLGPAGRGQEAPSTFPGTSQPGRSRDRCASGEVGAVRGHGVTIRSCQPREVTGGG